jgi:hypothetical protein
MKNLRMFENSCLGTAPASVNYVLGDVSIRINAANSSLHAFYYQKY